MYGNLINLINVKTICHNIAKTNISKYKKEIGEPKEGKEKA